MKYTQLYSQILGIEKPWNVTDVKVSLPEGEVEVFVERGGSKLSCPISLFVSRIGFSLGNTLFEVSKQAFCNRVVVTVTPRRLVDGSVRALGPPCWNWRVVAEDQPAAPALRRASLS
jgi:hypothetical protein